MKTTFLIILLLLGIFASYSISCKNFPKVNNNTLPDTSKTANQEPRKNMYMDLRNMALSNTPEKLGLKLFSQSDVYGVIMDWDLGNGTMTLACYKTGDASIYLTSGGGFIGGVQHENVNKAAKKFVDKAQRFLAKSTKTTISPLPDKDCVRFYLLTGSGIFSQQISMKNMKNYSSEWVPLFNEANEVIHEYNIATQKR